MDGKRIRYRLNELLDLAEPDTARVIRDRAGAALTDEAGKPTASPPPDWDRLLELAPRHYAEVEERIREPNDELARLVSQSWSPHDLDPPSDESDHPPHYPSRAHPDLDAAVERDDCPFEFIAALSAFNARHRRQFIIRILKSLERGERTPAMVVRDAIPASAVLSLAESEFGARAAWARPALVAGIRDLLAEHIGTDADLLGGVINHISLRPESLSELIGRVRRLNGAARAAANAEQPPFGGTVIRNILLALAPPETALELATRQEQYAPLLAEMAGHLPLSPALVHFAPSPPEGSHAATRAMVHNEDFTVAHMRRALAAGQNRNQDLLEGILSIRDITGGRVRLAAYEGLRALGWPMEKLVELVRRMPHTDVIEMAQRMTQVEQLHEFVAAYDVNNKCCTIQLYAILAERAGPEPVWRLHQERTAPDKLLRERQPTVPASILTGDIEPLRTAARHSGHDAWGDAAVEDDIDRFSWPLAELFQQRLAGRPDSWRQLVDLILAGDERPWPELVDAVTGNPATGH
ncbi:hypothetical protein AB0L06_42585 [Spirillospora sp. NPDC052269]